MQPAVRWYDARARVALRQVALWLAVPAPKLAVFECMLAQTAQVIGLQEVSFRRHRTLRSLWS